MNANLCQVTYSQSRYEPMTTVVLHKDFGEWGAIEDGLDPVFDAAVQHLMTADANQILAVLAYTLGDDEVHIGRGLQIAELSEFQSFTDEQLADMKFWGYATTLEKYALKCHDTVIYSDHRKQAYDVMGTQLRSHISLPKLLALMEKEKKLAKRTASVQGVSG